MHAFRQVARDRGAPDERRGTQEDRLPAGQLAEHADHCTRERALVRSQFDDDRARLLLWANERRVEAGGEEVVVAGEALRGSVARVSGERDERVDAREQLLALRPGRWIAEPIRGDERGDGARVRFAEREVRERRQPRLEAVDDVVVGGGQREREVGADTDGNAHLGAARDRHGRPDGDHAGRLGMSLEDPPAFE